MTTEEKSTSEQEETKGKVKVGKLEATEELTADELKKVKGGKGIEDKQRMDNFEIQQETSTYKNEVQH